MDPDSALPARVRAALAGAPALQEKRMFGSAAFMVRGKLCITASADRIMCRIDPALVAAALEREGCHAVIMRGRPSRGYVYVYAAAVMSSGALKYWVDLALNYNKAIS